jgi:site-specific DNA-cytosine methylase
MRVLIACEFSGRVRDAFISKGHDAWSCDLEPTSVPGPHIQVDVLEVIDERNSGKYGFWDLMIAHPPCTHLCVSGALYFHKKKKEQREALEFVLKLLNAPIPYICLENPVGIISTKIVKPTQIIQPWMFGHDEIKSTCLWLKRLPLLQATQRIPLSKCKNKLHRLGPSSYRSALRSKTYYGIARAMAEQWGELEISEWERDLPPRDYKIK